MNKIVSAALIMLTTIVFLFISGCASQKGIRVTLGIETTDGNKAPSEKVQLLMNTIKKRAKEFGVSKPEVQQKDDSTISVFLPGLSEPDIVQLMFKTAKLKLKDEGGNTVLKGEDVRSVSAQLDSATRKPVISLSFDKDVLSQVTAANVHKHISIYVDDQLLSSPVIYEPVTSGECVISGNFRNLEEAQQLASLIWAGSLPLNVKVLDSKYETISTAGRINQPLAKLDKYVALYVPFRCQEIYDLFSQLEFFLQKTLQSGTSPYQAGAQQGQKNIFIILMNNIDLASIRNRSAIAEIASCYLAGDDINAVLCGFKPRGVKPMNVRGNSSGKGLASAVVEKMIIKTKKSYEQHNDNRSIRWDYCYVNRNTNTAYFCVIFGERITTPLWAPSKDELGKPVVFRVHNPKLIEVPSDNAKNNTNSNYVLVTDFWNSDTYLPADVGDFSLEEAMQEYGMPLDAVIFVDLE